MKPKDHRVDAYIAQSAAFAQPVLKHLRQLVHSACPGIEESIKWGFPHFLYKGSILCSMASFKQHCAFTFRLAPIMEDPFRVLRTGDDKNSMGHFGRIKETGDLPADEVIRQYVKQASELIDAGKKLPRKIIDAGRPAG